MCFPPSGARFGARGAAPAEFGLSPAPHCPRGALRRTGDAAVRIAALPQRAGLCVPPPIPPWGRYSIHLIVNPSGCSALRRAPAVREMLRVPLRSAQTSAVRSDRTVAELSALRCSQRGLGVGGGIASVSGTAGQRAPAARLRGVCGATEGAEPLLAITSLHPRSFDSEVLAGMHSGMLVMLVPPGPTGGALPAASRAYSSNKIFGFGAFP